MTQKKIQVDRVASFDNLISFQFQGEVNAVCWERAFIGDFAEIVEQFTFDGNMIEISEKQLKSLHLGDQGQLAREILLSNLKLLKDHGADPTLNIIKHYDRDDELPFFPRDVYSFHVDRSPVAVDTFLCTYYGAPSEIIPNSQTTQKVLLPEIRAKLKAIHQGNDNEFEAFLTENFFDLHYHANSDAQPISLELGQLCRLATDHPNNPSLPCIHRAPEETDGKPRLLLIC